MGLHEGPPHRGCDRVDLNAPRAIALLEYTGGLASLAPTGPWSMSGSPEAGVEPVTSSQIADLEAIWRGEGFDERLRRRDLGVLARREGSIVGTAWMAQQPLLMPGRGLAVTLRGGEGYLYGIRVVAAARRQGIATALVLALAAAALDAQLDRFQARVGLRNRAGRRLQRHLGARLRAIWLGVLWRRGGVATRPAALRIPLG